MGDTENTVEQPQVPAKPAVSLGLGVLALGWLIGVPALLLSAIQVKLGTWMTQDVDAAHAEAATLRTWAAVLGVALPLAGLGVALWARRKGARWFFGICLVVSLVVIGIDLADSL